MSETRHEPFPVETADTMPREHIEGIREETLVVNMGPQHPSTHGVLRLVLELDGENVVSCGPVIGYLHTGIEKNTEYRSWQQGVAFVTRMLPKEQDRAEQADVVYLSDLKATTAVDWPLGTPGGRPYTPGTDTVPPLRHAAIASRNAVGRSLCMRVNCFALS